MKSVITLFSVVLMISTVSCSKDGAAAGADITGTYKFISLQAKTNSTIQTTGSSFNDKTVTTSEYTSLNNTGTITIDASRFISNNLGYSINATAKSTLYESGVLSDTFSFPFQLTIPSASGTGTYKRVGSDSLYFESGSALIGGTTSASQPGGAKIKFENGRLTLYGNVIQSTTTRNGNETIISVGTVASVIVLQKQ